MKALMIAALAALSAAAHTSTVEAAGWRSCKATSVNCTGARTKAVRTENQRRAAARHREVNSMPARDWFYRQMLDN
jgi:hypothetical protein